MGQATTLRDLREGAGFSQSQLSDRCKELGAYISQGRISEYENGDKFPGPDNVRVLAEALRTPPERLFSMLLAQRGAA